jgi:hypothetical protein
MQARVSIATLAFIAAFNLGKPSLTRVCVVWLVAYGLLEGMWYFIERYLLQLVGDQVDRAVAAVSGLSNSEAKARVLAAIESGQLVAISRMDDGLDVSALPGDVRDLFAVYSSITDGSGNRLGVSMVRPLPQKDLHSIGSSYDGCIIAVRGRDGGIFELESPRNAPGTEPACQSVYHWLTQLVWGDEGSLGGGGQAE